MQPHIDTSPDESSSAEALSAEPVVTIRSWIAIGILLLMTILSYIDRNIISLMIDPIKADLGIDDIQISLLLGFAFASFYALFSVPMGYAADRFSRRKVIFLGVGGWSVATASCGFARSYWQLFMARFAVGVGEAALTPAAYSLVGDLFPKRRLALALGILAAGTAAGSAIATGLGGLIIAWVTDRGSLPGFAPWQVVFILVGLPGLIIAPLIFLVPERRRAQRVVVHADKPVNDGYFAWLRNHRAFVIPFFSAVSLAGIISYAYGAWLPAYLSRRFGLPIGDIGVTLGLVQGIPGIIGFIGGGWFVDRMVSAGIRDAHLRYLCSAMAVAGVFAVVGMAFSQSVTMLFIFLGLFHLTIPFTGPSIALIQMVSPRRFHSRTIALYTLAINMVGMMIGPSSVALFTEKVYGGPQHVGAGITTVLAISAPLAVLCFFVSMGPARRAIAENAAQGG